VTDTISGIEPRSLRHMTQRLKGFIRARLWLQVLVAMVLGITTGILIGPSVGLIPADYVTPLTSWLALPGYLFLALIQMIVIPLVVASIILGMSSSESTAQLRSTGVRTGLFFLGTTVAAVVIGLVVASLIKPGLYIDTAGLGDLARPATQAAASAPAIGMAELPTRIAEVIPANPLRAGLEQNMLQVVVFALLIGVALVSMPRTQARPLLELLAAVQELSMVVVRWAMYLVPFAVFGLLVQLAARLGIDALLGMGLYVLTVIFGLALVLLMYLAILWVATKRTPLPFLKAIRDVQLLAFSTSSSAAVMPLTIQTAENRLNVSTASARFVIPLGTTINMAGTALYQVVATLFLAQVFAIDIGLSGLILVVFLAVGASIGSPGTPGIGIVILSMLLGSVGVPTAGIALIIGVDRILDMFRTTINVTGDLVASCVMDNHSRITAPEPQTPADPEAQKTV